MKAKILILFLLFLFPYSLHALEDQNNIAVTIIAYTDSVSRASSKARRSLDEIMQLYPDDVRIIYKDYPSLKEEAQGFGVMTAPTFFINGQKLVGARSVNDFRQKVDIALGIAQPVDIRPPSFPEQHQPSPASIVEVNTDGAPSHGPNDAQVVIVEFSDFQCPFCARATSTIQDLIKRYPKQVQWVFKHFPLDFHPDARLAHAAAMAAGEQGKFWEMHDLIFLRQTAIKREHLIKYAEELRLDIDQFKKALDSGEYQKQIDQDIAEGKRLGISGTPTFFVNGKQIVGARPIGDFISIIESELAASVN